MVNGCLPHNHMTFPCKICNNKNVNENDHAISISVNFGSTLNVIILSTLTMNIFKATMILGKLYYLLTRNNPE